MRRILKIAQREYLETARTKTFILMVLMTPVIIGLAIYFTRRLSLDKGRHRAPVTIAVTDLSNELAIDIQASFDKYNDSNPNRQILLEQLDTDESSETLIEHQKQKLRSGKLDAYVVLEKDVLSGDGKMRLYTCNTPPARLDVLWTTENLSREVVVNRRYQMQELDRKLLAELRQVPIERLEIGSAGGAERVQKATDRIKKMMIPFFFMYLMFISIIVTAQHMLSSVIEEKNSRVMEVLLSAVSPFQLMAGKIVGLAGIGFTVTGLWGVGAYSAANWQGLNISITGELLLYFVIYYALGFLLFSSITVGIGSICNTIKETQNLMMPITIIFLVPLISWLNLIQNPNGTLARVLSFIPPLTSMVMILRTSATSNISHIEILGSIVLLAATVLGVMWGVAKVFRTGILMYGKRPGPREILRWLRQT
ncbi:MAG: ABC transporter permease [Planctomycetota bacterium]|jgi:ABC-2 type transport system permease protein